MQNQFLKDLFKLFLLPIKVKEIKRLLYRNSKKPKNIVIKLKNNNFNLYPWLSTNIPSIGDKKVLINNGIVTSLPAIS